jgi:hypothetical protein
MAITTVLAAAYTNLVRDTNPNANKSMIPATA